MTRRTELGLIGVVLVGLALTVYRGVGEGEFLHFDDDLFVTGNPFVRQGLTTRSVVWAFQADLVYETPFADYWAPVTVLTRLLDVQLFGLEPGAHHRTNLLLHCANVLLLLLVFHALTGALWRSAFLAAIFTVHPLNVEAVAWVSARKDMVSGLFWLLTLWAYARYVRNPGRGRLALVVASFALGLMAKPMLATLPFVLLLLDRWPLGRSEGWVALLREKAMLFVLTGASVAITLAANLNVSLVSAEDIPVSTRVANAVAAYASYLLQFLCPRGLAIGYPHVDAGLSVLRLSAAGALLGLVSVAALSAYRTRPFLIVGWCWFLGTLLPTIGLVQSGVQSRADRYTYLPGIGLAIALVWLVADLSARSAATSRAAGWLGCGALALLAFVAARQVPVWRNDLALFTHGVRTVEGNAIAHNGLGATYLRAGDLDRAEEEFREALRARPNFVGVVKNLSLLLVRRGRAEEAVQLVETSLRTWARPGTRVVPELRFNLGLVKSREGKVEEALAEYAETLRLDPRNWAALYNSANLLVGLGRLEEAEIRYAAALRQNPDDADSASNLGLVRLLLGRPQEAVSVLESARKIDPREGRVRTGLGRALLGAGRGEEGLAELHEGVRLAPQSADAHFQLGRALEAKGAREPALDEYRLAQGLAPEDPEIRAAVAGLAPTAH